MKKFFIILLTLTLIMTSSFTFLPSYAAVQNPTDLFFTEYIEGSYNNKALEIYNGTGMSVDLSQYTLVNFTNGASQDPTDGKYANKLDLSGTLESGDVYVIANSNSEKPILDVADKTGNSYFYGFNGDDSIVLFKNYDENTRQGTVVDSIGKVGEDPGSYWISDDVKTQNSTLIRKTNVIAGDTTIDDTYEPSSEWNSLPKDTFKYLGIYPDDIQTEEPDEYISTVKSVVDGDTIHLTTPVLGVTKVRYVNIDTPETYHLDNYDINLINSNPDHSQKYHGEMATQYLNTLLKSGDEVVVKVGEEPLDTYGRLLAQIIRKSDGLNTNLEMVKQGYAVSYFIWPIGDEATYNEYQDAVKYASDNKLGIWNGENTLMELPFVFRAREQDKGLLRYVGNSATKVYVQPKDWATVPVENRIFFSEVEAIAAGYTPGFDREPIIAEARYAPIGSLVTIEGVVTAAFYIGGATNYYVQDETAGIIVRSCNLDAQTGDKLRVTGETSDFFGMLQIVTENTEIIDAGFGVPNPKYISADEIGEDLEGQLIAIEYVNVESVNKFNEFTANDSYGNTFTIDLDDNWVEVDKTYDTIIGVINYSYGSYKVMPRSSEDIIEDIPVISIKEAREADLDTKVNIEGVVTAAFYIGGATNYYVQDDTAGIVVRIKGLNAEIGYRIRAKAKTEEYFGMLQLQPILQNTKIINDNAEIPNPKLISSTDLGEDLEGQLVMIKYVTVDSVDSHHNYSASDEHGNFVIDSDNDFVEIGKSYEYIIGVLDYNYSEYKLMPRFIEDVVVLNYFTKYINGEENLSSVTDRLVESANILGLSEIKTLLNEQLTEIIYSNGNTVQHIESTVKHIMNSLSKLGKNNSSVEIKKIKNELEKIIKLSIDL